MKIRDDVLIADDDMGTSGTKKYDLEYVDVISSLELLIKATNGSSDNRNSPIERSITKIEIVDGSEVLWALPGDVAYALYTQEYGKVPYEYYSGAGGSHPYVSIPIRFGRELYDPELGFVPRSFKNPQLKVTFDEATVRAAGIHGFESDSFTLSVTARLMEDAPAPMGYLMAKDIHDFTTADTGDKKVPLPTDYPWRQLFIRVYEAGVWMGTNIPTYKLNCDRGKFVPFDSDLEYLLSRMAEVYNPISKSLYEVADNGSVVQTWMAKNLSQTVHAYHAGLIAGLSSVYNSQAVVRLIDPADGIQTDKPIFCLFRGWAPHNTLFIPFGRLDVMAEWFNAPQYGSVDLYLTQEDDGAEVNVCVQQLRSY